MALPQCKYFNDLLVRWQLLTYTTYSWFTNFAESFSANSSKTTQHTVMQFCSMKSWGYDISLRKFCQKPFRKNSEQTVFFDSEVCSSKIFYCRIIGMKAWKCQFRDYFGQDFGEEFGDHLQSSSPNSCLKLSLKSNFRHFRFKFRDHLWIYVWVFL